MATIERSPNPRNIPDTRSSRRLGIWALVVGLVALVVLGYDLPSEPYFADESAFISQSYFLDLYLEGKGNDPAWLSYPAIDLPTLPKYLAGAMLRAHGYRRPSPREAAAWYRDINLRIGSPEMLLAARWPSVVLGALGCVAVFGLGVLLSDRRVGAIAALLLLINPLYRLLARRAMADVPCESLVLLASATALWLWQRTLSGRIGPWRWIVTVLGVAILAGLAVLAKLNGGLALMSIGGWAVLAALVPGVSGRRKAAVVGSALLVGAVTFGTFALLNPTLTARPVGPLPEESQAIADAGIGGRVATMLWHRVDLSKRQRAFHSHYALFGACDKIKAVAVQGFGRFGPFGPRWSHFPVLYDWVQDRWALVWGPWVLLGTVWAFVRGRRQLQQAEPPMAWAVLPQAVLTLLTVVVYIPLAWDRYYLPIESGASLLGAGAAVAVFDRLVSPWVQHNRRPADG